jgi:hypothetical protein
MPGPVGVALAGLAAESWKEMWRLYNERYGKYGEETCKRLQREIENARADVADLSKMIDVMRDQLDRSRNQATHFHSQWLDTIDRANDLAGRLTAAMTRLERADLPPNPYDEGESGVPEPTEMDP